MTPEVQKKVAEVNGQLAALPDPILSLKTVSLLFGEGFNVGPGDVADDGRIEPLARAIGANSPWSAGAMAGPDTDLTTIREKWRGLTALTATLGQGRTLTRFVLSPSDRTLREYVSLQGVRASPPAPTIQNEPEILTAPASGQLPLLQMAIAQVAAWLDQGKTAAAATAEARAFVANAKIGIGRDEDQVERNRERVAKRDGDAFLNGEDLPEDDLPTRKKDQALNRRIRAAKSALPLAEARVVDACRGEELINAQTGPAIDLVGAHMQAALDQIGAALEQIVPSVEALMMCDIVRHHLVGNEFSTTQPDHPGLLSGRILATAFLENLPARLRPSAGIEDVTEKAAQRAAELIQKIEEARNV